MSEVARRTVEWKKILGWRHSEITAYVDTKSLERDLVKDYGYGVLLFTRQYPVDITINGKKIQVKSVVRYVIVDCKNMHLAPIMDLYFDTDGLPTISDVSIARVDQGPVKPVEILKKDPIYKTLCPEYI